MLSRNTRIYVEALGRELIALCALGLFMAGFMAAALPASEMVQAARLSATMSAEAGR